MTNQEILKKAIQKAIDGGWGPWNTPITVNRHADRFFIDGETWNIEAIIFNHDFAKALWGERKEVPNEGRYGRKDANIVTYENYEDWQYHLQQMVIADEPIAYLGENLL